MANETIDDDPFLAAIEMKIAALQALADSYRAVLATGIIFGGSPSDLPDFSNISTTVPPPRRQQSNAADVPKGAFRGMGIAAAIRAYLGIVKRKQTHREIVDALHDGGVVTTSSNFDKMVMSTLHRMRHGGELLQFNDGWDLADAYPESLRQRVTKKADAKNSSSAEKPDA
jgi:hypothetical protein